MPLARRFTDGRALTITLFWVIALAVAGSTDVLLFLAPALLIAIPLFCGLYVGEELIVKLAGGRRRPRRRAAVSYAPVPRPPLAWSPRGTRLLAFSRAERPPPLRLLLEN